VWCMTSTGPAPPPPHSTPHPLSYSPRTCLVLGGVCERVELAWGSWAGTNRQWRRKNDDGSWRAMTGESRKNKDTMPIEGGSEEAQHRPCPCYNTFQHYVYLLWGSPCVFFFESSPIFNAYMRGGSVHVHICEELREPQCCHWQR
jgi:hypothetical protein